MNIKKFVLKLMLDNHWTADLIVGLLISITWSRFVQTEPDDGEYSLIAILIGAGSYLFACLLSFKIRRMPTLLWIPVIGSIVYAFNWMVVYFLLYNWDPVRKAETLSDYLTRMPGIAFPRFIWASILFSVFALTLSLVFRAFLTVVWPIEDKR